MKKAKIVLIVSCMTLTLASTAIAARMTSFNDVQQSHWAYTSIQWGANQEIVNGYEDHTFKPNQNVTEAEFLKMLVSTFDKAQLPITEKWYSGYYTYAQEKNWALQGTAAESAKTKAITRQTVAELVVGAQGYNYTGDQAVQYLLGKGLSNGKSNNTIAGYEGNDALTRAEAIQFLMNLKNAGMNGLQSRPEQTSDLNNLPEIPDPINSDIKFTEVNKSNAEEYGVIPRFVEFMEQDKVSEDAVKNFISNLKIENSILTMTIPSFPNGYTPYISVNKGKMQKVVVGQTLKYDILKTKVVDLDVLVGVITKQSIAISLPSARYIWGAKHD
ncbi:S-layer homology domain-containing protein [Paenibacillus hunanensis]|uniref:S-layer homology domain-containing protein n=1 Tax=Paenibacillus hunanensis TaxID=539262 RepID=UPI0020265256|nr:S-layer homology domain-containing protein [Paenibacillus hunanensis]MCL9662132.1 S-layer homology domain-containing protein [Paenibacillus hunanensis]